MQSGDLPLRQVSETALTGGPVRFDYTALDVGRGRLFIAHMGASELIEVDVRAHTVVRTVPDLPDVHGVIVVPDKRRVYATATGANQLVAIDEDTGEVVFRAPTDTYPDGIAYDPIRRTVWTTNEIAGTETVIDADTGAVRVAAESGWVSIFDHVHGRLSPRGSAHLADGAHSLALDTATHHSYFPVPKGHDGSPVLWELEPT
jgi:hypothetical protein